MTVLMIILGIFVYLVIGGIYANLLNKFNAANDNPDEIALFNDKFGFLILTIIYPIIILLKIVKCTADKLTKILFNK
jgi:hypothetical protein